MTGVAAPLLCAHIHKGAKGTSGKRKICSGATPRVVRACLLPTGGASAQLQRRIRTTGEDRHCAPSGRRGETQALGAVSATWAT